MRTIVHISDIHFGRIDHALIEPLITLTGEIQPDLVAISGDLTQRALINEFEEARDFLKRLPSPQIVVPGNHDVPLYNPLVRFLNPLGNYKRYITPDLAPFYSDEEIAVAGINTTRRFTRKDGRINVLQVAAVSAKLALLPHDVIRIIVTHHPFDVPPGHNERDLVGRAHMAMQALAKSGTDLFLSGHLHVSRTGHSSERYKIAGHSALIVQAGTISTRARGESNAFNVIRIQRPEITVQRFEWKPEARRFEGVDLEHFAHTPDGWVRLSPKPPAASSGAL